MEAFLLIFLFLFAAVLILLTRFTNSNEVFMILAGILFVFISLPLNTEGITFDIATARNYTKSWIYDPATLTPTNSSVSGTYTNLSQKNIYTDGLSGLFFILGMYTTGRGGLMFYDKRGGSSDNEEVD